MSSMHDRKIRQLLRSGQVGDVKQISEWGTIDISECMHDKFSRTDGFKCHYGNFQIRFYFPRNNKRGFVEKVFHITKPYINDKMCVVWMYNKRVHDFREYYLDSDGLVYNANTSELVLLPFFNDKEWEFIARAIIKELREHKDSFFDAGHICPTSIRYTRSMRPNLRGNAPIQNTSLAQVSLVRQMQSNSDNSTHSVYAPVTHDESYWLHHSRKEQSFVRPLDPNEQPKKYG